MSWLKKIFNDWKAEYNIRQKTSQFIAGIPAAEAVLRSPHIEGNAVHFLHSGHAGDIIYSIPAMKALAGNRNMHLYLQLNQPNRDFTKSMQHPNGNVMLTEKSVSLFHSLVSSQQGFEKIKAHEGETIHYDLTAFRELPFDYRMGSIARWYFLAFGINHDLGKPWLSAQADNSYKNAIVLARSSRYRTPGIDHRFLAKYGRIVFVGMKEEYEDMRQQLPQLEYKPVNDFYEMASVIAGSRLFIGNQSFPFSLAEAMKVTRVLEVYPLCPNVIVEGANGYDFCYQPQFEKIVNDLLGQ